MLKTISSIVNAIGALNYKGTWNASTNTPTLASGVGTKGDYYVVSVAGSTNLDGETLWGVGDWAVFNGSIWQKVDGGSTGNFTSVNTGTLDVTGNTTLGDASTDTVRVNGVLGVGASAGTNRSIYSRPNATLSGTSQNSVEAYITGSSAATSNIRGFIATPETQAASFTCTNVIGFDAQPAIKGAGSTITNAVGLYLQDQTQGTNNYGILSIVSSGANKYNIYASGTAQNYFAGDVGIGTTSPAVKLVVSNAGANGYEFDPANSFISSYNRSTSAWTAVTFRAGSYTWNINNSNDALRLDSSGNLGIGTASPANRLDIVNSASGAQMTIAGSDGQYAGMFGGTGSAGPGIFFLNTAPALRFGTGTAKSLGTFTELMRLTAGGNLGLGVTPSAWASGWRALQSLGGNSFYTDSTVSALASNAIYDGAWKYVASSGAGTYQINRNAHTWFNAPSGTAGNAITFTTAMTLDASGNLGIGTTSAGDRLSLGGAIRVTQDGSSVGVYLAGGMRHTGSSNFYIDSNTGGAAGNIIFRNGSGFSEQMRLSSSGNLGIGTTSPVNKLQVAGSFGRGAPVTKTGNFTLADTENWIICNGTGTITVTLPAASSWTGREFTIKTIAAFTVISNASNVVPLAGGAAGTAILAATAGTWATLVSDGTNWIIMQA